MAEEADKLIFENEHTLSTKPMLIDVLVIKKNTEEKIHKNIGRIFRKHNIIEYKSPTDYLSIDDFYKVYGYTCFYKSSATKQDSISAEELTITFVCKKYPKRFVEHLKEIQKLKIVSVQDGIYYIVGNVFLMQLIVTSELSADYNLWLNSLTNDLKGYDIIDKISSEYSKHEREEIYKSVMDVIVRANENEFREANNMCEALHELWKDDIDKAAEQARNEEKEKGIESTINACKSLGGSMEQAADILVENMELTIEKAYDYLKKYW